MIVQDEPKLIGAISKQSGLPVKTIRYYEELGLLKTIGRTEGGYRLFRSDTLSRLHFIKRAQSLGLSLSEIKAFLEVRETGDFPCVHVRQTLQDKLSDIDRQILELQRLKLELTELLSDPTAQSIVTETMICPILESV
ncbi:MAG: heavy metal-responsive transcriptional regulator [Leptolyngbya sp. Prado105]|jgi:DNA-binding transcriptional MerR regulator|nr:heavy metal-responsive transcriptional regulator [Leptolyngbya sp. Prado105]